MESSAQFHTLNSFICLAIKTTAAYVENFDVISLPLSDKLFVLFTVLTPLLSVHET